MDDAGRDLFLGDAGEYRGISAQASEDQSLLAWSAAVALGDWSGNSRAHHDLR